MKDFKAVVNETAPGEYWGIEFPFTPQMLRDMGPKWLTKAMHTAGTLPRSNAVTRFVSMDVKAEDVTQQDAEGESWGGAGLKILLRVEYKNADGNLSEGMFIKMPHEFTGKNERFKNSVTTFGMDWSEVSFYNLYGGRYGSLPFRLPKMYFCDMSRKTTNFINIIEMVPYGKRGTEKIGPGEPFPAPDKYRDWNLPGCGVEHYYAHTRTLARFFGWHRKAREVTDQVEKAFMDPGRLAGLSAVWHQVEAIGAYNSPARDAFFVGALSDPATRQGVATMGFSPAQAEGFLDMSRDVLRDWAKHVLPKDLVSGGYLERFYTDCQAMSKYCAEMMFYTSMVPEYFCLMHPNAQVDNAWYWRDMSGEVQCGLLDWGAVVHGSIPQCIGNAWIGSEPAMMDEHEEGLVRCFVDEFEKVTGFRFDVEDLHLHIKLVQATVIFGCSANVGTMLRKLMPKEKWAKVKSRMDPEINDNFLVRCYYVQMELFIEMWRKRSPHRFFEAWRRRTRIPPK